MIIKLSNSPALSAVLWGWERVGETAMRKYWLKIWVGWDLLHLKCVYGTVMLHYKCEYKSRDFAERALFALSNGGTSWPADVVGLHKKIVKKSRSRFTHTRDLISTHSNSEAFYISSWITNKCSYFPPRFFEAPPNAALPLPPPSTCGKASLQHVIQWRKPTCSWVCGRSDWEAVFRRDSKPPICPSFWRLCPRF